MLPASSGASAAQGHPGVGDDADADWPFDRIVLSARLKTLGAVKDYGLENTVAAYERLYERVVSQRC